MEIHNKKKKGYASFYEPPMLQDFCESHIHQEAGRPVAGSINLLGRDDTRTTFSTRLCDDVCVTITNQETSRLQNGMG